MQVNPIRVLAKYIKAVGDAEGVDFIYESDYTPEEFRYISQARELANWMWRQEGVDAASGEHVREAT